MGGIITRDDIRAKSMGLTDGKTILRPGRFCGEGRPGAGAVEPAPFMLVDKDTLGRRRV